MYSKNKNKEQHLIKFSKLYNCVVHVFFFLIKNKKWMVGGSISAGMKDTLFLTNKQRQNAAGIKKRVEKNYTRVEKQSGSIKDNKCWSTGLIIAPALCP